MIENLQLYNENIKEILMNDKFEMLKNKSILITGANRIDSFCYNRYIEFFK